MMSNNDEFYLGYAKKAPKNLSRFIIIIISVLSICVLTYSVANHFFRVSFHSGVTSKKYVTLEGLFVASPYPMLLSLRAGKSARKGFDQVRVSRYYVAPPGKKSLGKIAKRWDGKYVSIGGQLIYRENQTMFVINKKSFKEVKRNNTLRQIQKATRIKDLGIFSLEGEIVDSKCYLGQMQPGSGKTHKECASLCIRGGLPPLFATKLPKLDIPLLYAVLVSPEGKPVNQQILKFIGEPMKITGNLIQRDNLYFLEANLKKYKRLSSF